MIPVITFKYAAFLALLFIFLTFKVVKTRGGKKLAFGDGGHTDIQLAVRTHANFAEYVPFALILLFAVEVYQWPQWLVHLLCIALIAARVTHIIGMRTEKLTKGRLIGAAATWLIMAISAFLILFRAFVGV